MTRWTMKQFDSIYTKKRECQDCHKCIRECPVKAIRVQDAWRAWCPNSAFCAAIAY